MEHKGDLARLQFLDHIANQRTGERYVLRSGRVGYRNMVDIPLNRSAEKGLRFYLVEVIPCRATRHQGITHADLMQNILGQPVSTSQSEAVTLETLQKGSALIGE